MKRGQRSKSRQNSQAKKAPANQKKQQRRSPSPGSSGEDSSKSMNRSRSGSRGTVSESGDASDEIIFSKNTYIAFVDPSGELDAFSIGLVLEDHRGVDEEVSLDVYEEVGRCKYTRAAANASVAEHCIIGAVAVIKPKGKKGKANDTITITQQNYNSLNLLMENVVAKLKDAGSEKSDSSENESENDQESESGSGSEEEDDGKDTEDQIKNRRIVTAKKGAQKPRAKSLSVRRVKAQSQSTASKKQANDSKKSDKNGEKKDSKQQTARKGRGAQNKNQKDDNDDEEDKQMENSESALVQIRKSAGGKRGGTAAKRSKALTQVIGTKRRTRGKLTGDGSGSEASDEDGDDDGPRQQRNLGNGKAKSVKPAAKKKAPKMPTEFKKGKWNPDVEIVDIDLHKEDESDKCYFDCCIRCNNKNVIRAAITGNKKLLSNCISANKQISQLTAFWSPEITWTAIEHMVLNNEHDLLEILLHPKVKVPAHSNYDQERNMFYTNRVTNPTYLMNFIDSGMVSKMAYGARVRKVQMTRGNRQGNNAFLEYQDNYNGNPANYLCDDKFLKRVLYNPGKMTVETFQMLYKLNSQVENTLNSLVYEAVRAGNRKIAFEIVKNLVKFPNWGFNNLHMEALGKSIDQEKVLKASVNKKANTNQDLTPLHCACINPNPKILKQFLDVVNNEVDVPDTSLRRPIHYAAANENAEVLNLLIEAGAPLQTLDNQKTNCLHIACQTGRAENVRLILQKSPGLIHLRTKQSMTPIAFACKYGHIEVVKVLVEFKAKINVGSGAERLTPLQWAATYGHYELCEYLVAEAKARVLGKDKYKRTALTMAVRNGHTKIASLLLQRGSEWDHPDSSVNTPLHYAAAYGWLDSMNLLLKVGADVNAQNSWRITPINIAMLKNHQGCVKRLLDEPDVDVNCKDEKGRTLLMLALCQIDEESEAFIKYLLKKGANPNIVDLQGQTILHYLAKYKYRDDRQNKSIKSPRHQMHNLNQLNNNQEEEVDYKKKYQQFIEIQKRIANILIESGVDLSHKDEDNKTAFAICLSNENVALMDLLKSQISFNVEPDLFFEFGENIFNIDYQKILRDIIKNDPPTGETINYLDTKGMSPFLSYIRTFVHSYDQYLHDIVLKVNQYSLAHNNNLKAIKITNKDLFDKYQDNNDYHTYNPNISQEEKTIIAKQILNKEILTPFIETLSLLIKNGANPHAQVQKMKQYREEEIQRIKEAEEIKLNGPKNQTEDEKVKKREEVLKEQNMPRKKTYGAGGSRFTKQSKPAATSHNDVLEVRGGKKIVREYSKQGLRNAFHLIVECPEQQLVEFLINLKLNPDLPDYDQLTPFNLISHQRDINGASNQSDIIKFFRQQLISLDVRIDYPDVKGRTPFLNYYENKDLVSAGLMLDLGANVNQMDNSGLFALKYALIRRDNPGITYLLERGANINQIDNKGRNLLHHAVNMSSATADATFETEQFLIEKGVEINLKDVRNRTPLHYAFIKIRNWTGNSQIDPIETVSSLCGYKKLELDVEDKWKKTPLHYASQRGASCSAMYLIQKGANSEKEDIYGNTPLGVCLLNHHYNYGILLIQKNANVNALVYRENPEELEKKWKAEALLYKKTQKIESGELRNSTEDQDMIVDGENSEEGIKSKKAHRKMFTSSRKHIKNDPYGDEDYGDEDYDDEYDDEVEDYRHENAFNNQNAFGMKVYSAKKKPTRTYLHQQQYQGQNLQHNQVAAGGTGEQPVKKEEVEGCSLFKLAIRAGQQGLAYLMMTNGYDLMLCIQDAMDEKKFMLVLTLLAKTAEDEVVQKKNNKGQNLFHILSMNSSSCQFDHLVRIYEALSSRGVDCKAKDIYKRTALHYAVISRSLELVRMLLTQPDAYNPNEIDVYGQSPLSLCLQGKKVGSIFHSQQVRVDNIFELLAKHGADVNFIYPETEYKPAFTEDQVNMNEDYDPLGPYKCSILINVVRQNPDFETIMRQNILGLLQYGANLSLVDSDGRDALMYAIMNNNDSLVKMLFQNQKTDQIDKNCQDKIGKSAAHYVVNPIKFGSFENTQILRRLQGAGFSLRLKDNQGRTPSSYAQEQESGVMLKELQKLQGNSHSEIGQFHRAVSIVEVKHWPQPKVDYDLDSEAFMQIAKEKEEAEHKDKKIPVDSTGQFEKSYEVYYDDDRTPWDSYLVKVDLKNGIYGDYVFYKMQLLYDRNRDLYVVFTRWGRIGEDGMNQRSPFNNVAEAKEDYMKIFKAKTGNLFNDKENFVKQKKKYNIAHVNYITTNYKDYLSPFDYEKCPKSRLHKEIYELFEEVSNITMYQRAMHSFGVDLNVLPFSGIKKEVIINAKEVLGQIQEAVKEDAEISKAGIKADFDQLTAIKEKISQLSSEFYELIPLANYKNSIAPPLCHQHQIKQQYDNLQNLSYIEQASRVLLGAVYRQNEINPIDYVYNSVNMLIEPLDKEGPEYEVIRTYIKNTRNNDQGENQEIFNIFKIQRKGEAEVMQAYKDLANHLLLFHGSQMFNFLGILQQGLKIAPPEAPPTGHLFGKGVYFADMYDKSANYNYHSYNQQESSLMLLCEVALGKSKEVIQTEYIEELPPQYQSLKAQGRMGPDYDNMLTLPNGTKIPYGKIKDYYAHLYQQQQQNAQLKSTSSYLGNRATPSMVSPMMAASFFGGNNPFGQPQLAGLPAFANNEYVVYNTSQIRMRYLIQMKKEAPKQKN